MNAPHIDFDPRADYYAALGLKSGATDAEIKRAYRELAKKYHPDATGGDKTKESRFKEVSQAYDVLGKKEKREQYDAIRAGGFATGHGPRPSGMGGFDMGDLFSQMFSGGGGPAGGSVRYEVFTQGMPRQRARRHREVRAPDGTVLTQKGDHVYSDLRISLDEALLGTVKNVATLTGKANLKVPPGTSSGTKLRLRGQGAGRGDHYVTVHIDIPKKKLNAKAHKLLADLMRHLK